MEFSLGTQSILLQDELEMVQKRAARFVRGTYVYETGSMTGILKQLKWESLKKRRKDSRLKMLHKGLKGAASLPTNDLVPPIRHTRNHPLPWHSKSQWLGLIYTSPVSSPPPPPPPPDYKRLELPDRFPYLCF